MAQVVEAPDGGVLAEVQYMGQTAQFSPVQLLAMILVDEREIAVADGHPVTDCVVTVPVFYNEVDLAVTLAMPVACHAFGLNFSAVVSTAAFVIRMTICRAAGGAVCNAGG